MTALTRAVLVALVAGALSLIAAPAAQAGGPLAVCSDGTPFLWPNGGQNVVWNADQGNLGNFDKAAADDLVESSFNQWQAIDTATISFVQGADLPLNVDETNFGPFFEPTAPDGLSAIIYDDTGAIFELLFGPGSGVLGFAGPEWIDPSTCSILEGVSFLNGPEFDPVDFNFGFGITVHEFGHFGNLAHSQTNGGILLGLALGAPQASGPDPFDTFGAPTVDDFIEGGLVETMYPFIFGSTFGTESPGRDDVTMMSRLYPEDDHFATTAAITGRVLGPNGTTRISGVNVIARNVADPFLDAVSAISGDFTLEVDPALSDVVGTYQFTGLTPGAQYAVFVDEILQGGFSTPPRQPLPGPEEFHSGAAESASDPLDTFTAVSAGAGGTAAGVDIIFNVPQPGDPLGVGDDGAVELFPPFAIDFCGRRFDSLFVNANGSVTFGAPDPNFFESTLAHLIGPARIAGLWDDLNPAAGGVVTFTQSANTFTVSWSNVPEFPTTGANSFAISFTRKDHLGEALGPLFGNRFSITFGGVSATDGLVGYSCGGAFTGGFEQETDLSNLHGRIGSPILPITAIFEEFVEGNETFDLAGELRFHGVNKVVDLFELGDGNETFDDASRLPVLPFNSAFIPFATTIEPLGGDVDFFSIRAKAGDFVAIEVVRGQLDSLLGVFDADTGELLAVDDDGGDGLLSRLILQVDETTRLAFAVTTFPDFDFVGAGGTDGRYTLFVNTYHGEPIALGDDDTLEVPLGGFVFDFQGEPRSSVFVNSNGSLSFEAGDPSFAADPAALLAGPPRIAPLWTDLDPTGALGNPGLIVVDTSSSGSATVHFVSVSQFFSSTANYFSVELCRHGRFKLHWGPSDRGFALVGATEGGGAADPGPTDLSRARPDATGTTYELFVPDLTMGLISNFDLFFDQVDFQ
ncbi:MAG TPA: hypothetical protein VK698_07295 [Kofleriaceae bacterium]|nr:hypothetical protein [Kofleriaceae bacterium]